MSLQALHVTTIDAGYYSAGYNATDSRTRQGVVLVVSGRPTKPVITGNFNIPVNEKTALTCNSRSTSTPKFFKKIPAMKYTWFVNNTEIPNAFNQTLEFQVRRSHVYDKFTCHAQERLRSESDVAKIEPFYGPDIVRLIPSLDEPIQLRDRGLLGPFNCTAECNPPCVFHWMTVHPDGQRYDIITNGSMLPIQVVNKNNKLTFRCVVTGRYYNSKGSRTAYVDIKPEIQYGPEKVEFSPNINSTITVRENDTLGPINCSADCNPPCKYRWESINATGHVTSAQKGHVLPQRFVGRNNISRYRCMATGNVSNTDGFFTSTREININVAYISKPNIHTIVNGNIQNDSQITTREGDNVTVVCEVDGYPTPNVVIKKGSKTGVKMVGNMFEHLSHYTFMNGMECNDSDIYVCIGRNIDYGEKLNQIQLKIDCAVRLDTEMEFNKLYSTTTGKNKTVEVNVPVISKINLEKTLKENDIKWDGNARRNEINVFILRRNETDYYWIRSLIPVFDESSLGNYTLFVRDSMIVSISIQEREKGHLEISALSPGTVIALGIGGAILVTCFISLMTFRRRMDNGKEPESVSMNTLKQPNDMSIDGVIGEVQPHHSQWQIAQISRFPQRSGSSKNWFSENVEYEVLHHYAAIMNVPR
ncbi:uncharacterized protein LOC134246853 [Saccostrea cucullata]|uniref:uncharacterized protein LOC134246853 n=1 Tax=Saccostrea cuccullata TaxID=36930 RepID=UPI002ED4C13F